MVGYGFFFFMARLDAWGSAPFSNRPKGSMKSGRYETSKLMEAQFEPGSRERVLKNLLRIKSKREMDRIEGQEQIRALAELIRLFDRNHRFTADDLRKIHKIWLGKIYAWAGEYRRVNLSKGDFPFAAARHISQLMEEFKNNSLRQFTPCHFDSLNEAVKAIAIVHTELVLIHPFREGNGRVARLLSILMALQAELPPLDFGGLKGQKRNEYFSAVKAGLDKDYEPMEKVFNAVIRRTLRISGRS